MRARVHCLYVVILVALTVVLSAPLPVPARVSNLLHLCSNLKPPQGQWHCLTHDFAISQTSAHERESAGRDFQLWTLLCGFIGGAAVGLPTAVVSGPILPMFWIGVKLGATFGMGIGAGMNWDTLRRYMADGLEDDGDRVALLAGLGREKLNGIAVGMEKGAQRLREGKMQKDVWQVEGVAGLMDETADWLRWVADGANKGAQDLKVWAHEEADRIGGEN